MKDPTTIDTYYVKLQGKGNIPEALEIGRNYKLEASGTITTKTETDNDDGSHSHYYKFEPVIIELVNDIGERIKAKDTRSQSQLFRAKLRHIYNFDENISVDFDTFYKNIMSNLIENAAEVAEMYRE